jgi:hypothetical protein
MAIDEALRHTVYEQPRSVLGDDTTVALMEHIPWTAPATAEQLDALEHRLDAKLDAMEQRLLALMETRLSSMQRILVIALVAVVFNLAALNLAAFYAILSG